MDDETIDYEWLSGSLEDFGYGVEEDVKIINKLKQLCTEFNKTSDSMLDDVMAALLNNKKKTLNYFIVEQLEQELEKKLKKTLGTPTAKPHVSRITQIGKSPAPVKRKLDDLNALVASPAVDGDFEKRKDVGKIVSSLKGKLFQSSGKAAKISIGLVTEPVPQFYASDKPAYVINAKSERMTKMANIFKEQYPEITEWHNAAIISPESVFVYGEVVNDIWEGQPFGEGNPATLLVDDENGSLVKLDLTNIKDFCLFSGMIIAMQGVNENGETFVASKLFQLQSPALPKIQPENLVDSGNLHIMVACGPFTSNVNCSYSHLQMFLDLVKEQKPNIVILMGPFVDRRNKSLTEKDKNTVAITYETQHEAVLLMIARALEGTSTHVILQPNAQRDACLVPEFPCSPLQVPGEISRILGEVAFVISRNFYYYFFNFQRLHLISDPAIISVNGIQIGMVGPDILAHLSKSTWLVQDESDSQPSMDRITRLAASLLSQRLLYPLCPPHIPASLCNISSNTSFSVSPHLIILPSMLIACLKPIPSASLAINPSSLCRYGIV
ncbi:hypothetical protein WR25_07719 isoform J [Diploscapter pachys]|uniref:DNA polymerase alpha subunit B n=2 Tax=Diploscapter pachys TaxID=2018661 RepID=A0A2A2KIQ0_9BILA|nr:hypothetical protein WR25_07719 isoform J [Diploscapter pachys]